MEYKNILVCSVPCWNKKSGSDTMSSLLTGYSKEKLANLYIREDFPDSDVCEKYFRISENAVIKSIFKPGIKTGKQIYLTETTTDDNTQNAEITNQRYQKHSGIKRHLLLFAREILWFLGKWKSPELEKFIDDFKPDVVFFAMEGYIHFNRINRYILKKTGAKGIGYFWDDNFTYKQNNKILSLFYRFFQRRSLKKLAKECDSFFAITPKTKEEADETFNINCTVLTKPIDFSNNAFTPYTPKKPIKMVYTGKLIIGRDETIRLIGQALDKINETGKKIELDVYTTTKISSPESFGKSINLKGAVPQTEIPAIQKDADILLFAEAINGPKSKTSRLSFSTKITDYFGSGKCIFAVGRPDVAPMEYLKENDAALCAYDSDSIYDSINKLCENPELINQYAQKAYQTGYTNHNKKDIQKTLFEAFSR